jgi:VanZ family protein
MREKVMNAIGYFILGSMLILLSSAIGEPASQAFSLLNLF